MIDPITEHILLENQAMNSLKRYMVHMKKAAARKDIKAVAKLSKMLPETSLKSTKRFGSKLPNFKKKYEEAKKAVKRNRILDPEIHEPASVAVAIVAATSNKTVSEIMNVGTAGISQGYVTLLLPLAGKFALPLIKLGFFTLIIMSIYVTGGQIIVPAFTGLFKTIGYLLGLVGKAFKGAGTILSKTTDQSKVEKAIDQVNDMMSTNLKPPKVIGLDPKLAEKMKEAGEAFGPFGGEHLPGTAGLFFKTKK